MNELLKGSNGLIVNDKVLFLIETKKVPDSAKWLFDIAKKYGISRHECKVLENNPTPDKHHLCHAYAAYSQSGFSDASILIIDGMNEIGGISIGIYSAESETVKEVRTYPMAFSLGSFYAQGVTLCGFGDGDYAGKLMGASAYADDIPDCPPFFLVDSKTGDVTDCNGIFIKDSYGKTPCIFEGYELLKTLVGSENIDPKPHFDFRSIRTAGLVQHLFEQSVFSLLEYIHNTLPSKNLVIGGGCALNCVCNGKIIRSGKWDNLFIPCMCEDQGNIVGRMVMEYNQKITEPFIYNKVTYPIPKEYNRVISKEELATRIRNGQIVAWFEGGSEYGPRALCHRSILANPMLKRTAYRINEIKHREYWRPLAPVVIDTHFKTFFDVDGRIWHPHKVMLATEYIRDEWQRKLPAVCAPDNSSRPQVLIDNPYNHTLYSLMHDYDLPILVNTSMNDAGEPICETPENAITFAEKNDDVLLVFVKDDVIYTK